MKAYLINLARSTDRLASADAQLRAAGIAYERVEAVDGRALGWGSLRRAVSRFRFFLASCHFPSLGEVGCTLSHNRVLRAIAESAEGVGAVFEDDLTVDGAALREALALVEGQARPEVPAVYVLSNHDGTPPPPGGRGMVRLRDGFYAEAYVATAAAARRLLFLNEPIRAPIDTWRAWAQRGVEVWKVFPTACGQSGVVSDIWGKRTAARKRRARWGWYVALWRARVRLGWALDGLIYRMTGR